MDTKIQVFPSGRGKILFTQEKVGQGKWGGGEGVGRYQTNPGSCHIHPPALGVLRAVKRYIYHLLHSVLMMAANKLLVRTAICVFFEWFAQRVSIFFGFFVFVE